MCETDQKVSYKTTKVQDCCDIMKFIIFVVCRDVHWQHLVR